MERKQLLDHGYLEYIEGWGSDERIIEAARMSTGKGFLGWGLTEGICGSCGWKTNNVQVKGCPNCMPYQPIQIRSTTGDEKLLRYLWEHKHATPFEMAGMVIEVQAPIMVFREWHRHRTQCLAGDTMIPYFSPCGTSSSRTIRQLFELKRGVEDNAPARHKNGLSKAGTPVTRAARRKDTWRTRVLPHCQTRVLRTIDELTGAVSFSQTADIYESGRKEIFSLRLANGLELRTSADHPVLTPEGWVHLADLRPRMLVATAGRVPGRERPIPPILRSGIGVWTTMMRSRLILPVDDCHVCNGRFLFNELQLDHVVPVRERLDLALNETNLAPICLNCHRGKTGTEQYGREGQMVMGRRWEMVDAAPHRVAEEMTYDIEMSGPNFNFVAGGIFVHNSYNEMSARYTPLPDLNYIPTVERLMLNSKTNKQAGTIKGAEELTEPFANMVLLNLDSMYREQEELYQQHLAWGVPKELARVHLPVGRYSRMRASANLRNWLAFLTLRMAPEAQYEIRMYANAVGELIAEKFPRTWELFVERR